MRNLLLSVIAALMFMPFAFSQNQNVPNLMPLPKSIQYQSGQLTIDSSFSTAITGHNEERLQRALARMTTTLGRQTGLTINGKSGDAANATLVIHADQASEEVQKVGEDESYDLTVTAKGANLKAANPLGILRGLQTFLQLVELTPKGYAVPAVTIKDEPRFPWRGLMIDVSRHWQPIEVIKRNLDGMEAVKLNTFHWHLSDNQGVRVESKKFPKLQEMGSDGHFFSQEEVKDVIAYGRDRGIRVIPEFDWPGHSTAFFVGHPELASGSGPYSIEREFGIFDPALDPTKESTYKFLDAFIGEMAALFPDPYFHIGGDEVNGKEWDRNPKIQEYMKAHGIKNNDELQATFTKRVQEIVAKHHKTMVGWDEILSPEIPKSIVIQSWRGPVSLAAAAKQGYKGLLSFGFYLDLFQPASFHYLNEPISGKAAELNDEEKKMILGGEACMWSELVTPDTIDSRIWPRMAAIAERLWSPQNTRDVRSMYTRMEAESMRLEWLGLKHRSYYQPALERLVESNDIAAIKTLADVVSAPQEYGREGVHVAQTGHVYRSTESYNRLVDATKPESITAVEFGFMVDDLLAKKATPAEIEKMKTMLTAWRDNDPKLQPQLQASFLLKEAVPLSQTLSATANSGLMALEYLQNGSKPAPGWASQQMAAIDAGKKAQGELLVAIAPAVQKLVKAAGAQ
ncbi:Beta-N-acetylhexosaminidase [Candidatus Koribacter versatilis Ellin345]|uniref:Beta-N-acetylhexosaminidase n=1 Tax=Koribacter versatilis (strain Ellin345) TaxID=204669 RepID=Q1IKV6_KORVE|nr:family 20 glycosylhydrolase [Candidatus Koribacter versatilis]ABF42494.1 Beta-N-acetylhexosaminidase [Candidatus Koribacter versatilis Ellin345]